MEGTCLAPCGDDEARQGEQQQGADFDARALSLLVRDFPRGQRCRACFQQRAASNREAKDRPGLAARAPSASHDTTGRAETKVVEAFALRDALRQRA